MRKLALLGMTTLCAVGVLWACGSSSGDDDDSIIPYEAGPDVGIRYDTGIDGPDPAKGQGTDFCNATLGTVKAAITSCCSPAEATGLTEDVFHNIDAYIAACSTKLEASIAAHRTAPTPQDFEACENGYRSVFGPDAGACGAVDTYRVFDVLSPSCATAFTGKGVVNDGCSGDFDCGNGLVCIGYSDTVDGKCQAPAPQDGVCGKAATSGTSAVDLVIPAHNSCTNGLYCNGGTCKTAVADNGACTTDQSCTGQNCLMGHCAKARSGGSKSINGDGCVTSSDCQTGFFCEIPGNIAALEVDAGAPPYAVGTCAPSRSDGQGCDGGTDHQCLSNSCSSGSCDRRCSYP